MTSARQSFILTDAGRQEQENVCLAGARSKLLFRPWGCLTRRRCSDKVNFLPFGPFRFFTYRDRILKTFVVVNPNAKRNKKRPDIASKLERILGPLAAVRVTSSIESIREIAREAKAADCITLGVCGGDGTLHHTLSAFRKEYGDRPLPRILTLGGGTMNMVCHSLNVLGPSEGIAYRFREVIERGDTHRTVERDTMVVDGRICFIFGVGLVTNFLDAYYEGGTTGPAKAALLVQQAIVSVMKRGDFAQQLFSPWSGEVTIADEKLPYPAYTALLAQTIENLALGFKPMYRAFEQPGHYHVLATQLNPVRLVNYLPKIWRGRPIRNPDMYDRITRKMVLKPAVESLYTMDGDLYSFSGPLTVDVGPRLTFWVV
jgi:diacylglycerol kinase family enzyme